LAEVLFIAGIVERICGSPRNVKRYAEEVVALSSEHSFPSWLGTGTSQLGWSVAALGDPRQGLDLISKGIALRRAIGAVLAMAWTLASQAEVHAAVGRSAEAFARMNEAIQVIDTTEDRMYEAEVFRLRGDLLSHTGDQPAAEESYSRALAVARRQSAKCSNCGPPPAWRGSGVIRADGMRLASFSLRSTAGLPMGSTRAI
jgi:tetratricopeptide (TPR) repeat protein